MTPCRHPKAARAIRVVDGKLVTVCWGCQVRREVAIERLGRMKAAV